MPVLHVRAPNRTGSRATLRARRVVAQFRLLLADLSSACRDRTHNRSFARRESTPNRAISSPTRFVTAVCASRASLSQRLVLLIEIPTFASLPTPFQLINQRFQ